MYDSNDEIDSLNDEEFKSNNLSPIKQMRQSYEKENKLNSQRISLHQDSINHQSWNEIATAFYQNNHSNFKNGNDNGNDNNVEWIKDIQPLHLKENNHILQNNQYDENYSVNSTPPQQKYSSNQQQQQSSSSSSNIQSSSSNKLRLSSSLLINSNRLKSAMIVFRWLTKLNLIPSSIPPLEINSNTIITKNNIDNIQDYNIYIPTFSDGIILGKLIQKLERCGPINGWTEQPKSRAQKLQNIRKILNYLSNNNKIPLSSLAIEEEILKVILL